MRCVYKKVKFIKVTKYRNISSLEIKIAQNKMLFTHWLWTCGGSDSLLPPKPILSPKPLNTTQSEEL